MFRINSHDARTDLYGIGKGAAQVIDLSPLRQQAADEANRNFSREQYKLKQDAEKEAELQDQIAKMNVVKIAPKDQELIANKLQEVRDYVVKNNGMRDASPAQMMEFQRLMGDAKMSADQSQNFREAWEQRGLQLAKEPEKYRPEAIKAHLSRMLKEDAGNWVIDDSIYRQNINYLDRVKKDLEPLAKERANATQTPWSEKFGQESANQLIADDLRDANLFEQAAYDFNNAKDKKGAQNPIEYYQKLYTPYLTQNQRKAGPQSNGTGEGNKPPKIAARYNKVGDNKGIIDWEYTTPPDNPYLTSSIGDVRPGLIHDDGENTYMEVTTKPDSEGNFEKKKLGYEETLGFIHNKLRTNLRDLREGKSAPHIDLLNKDSRSSVKAGHEAAERVRGGSYNIKGKTYSLKELMDMGYTEDQVSQYKSK